MDAVVLVGGQGTRLRPLTETTPKPMLPVAGVPFLAHLLARARAAGIDHVILSTSYRAEVFEAHFGSGAELGLALEYVTEAEPLGTGGGIRNVASRLRAAPADPVVVFNGDVLSSHDVAAQVRRHVEAEADVTLHLTEVPDPRAFGCVPLDAAGRVLAFHEKSEQPVTNRINAGCYVFRRQVLEQIPGGRPVSVEREVFPALIAAGALVLGHVDAAYWLDLGTPASFLAGCHDLVTGRARSPLLPEPPGEVLVLPGARVAAGAHVGGGSTVGAGAVVADGAEVTGSVLFDDVQVGPGARLLRSVAGRGAQIGAGAVLEDAVVGDGARVGAGNELRRGARLWTGATLADGALRF